MVVVVAIAAAAAAAALAASAAGVVVAVAMAVAMAVAAVAVAVVAAAAQGPPSSAPQSTWPRPLARRFWSWSRWTRRPQTSGSGPDSRRCGAVDASRACDALY